MDISQIINIKRYLPQRQDVEKLSSFFQALSDYTRLKIVILLTIKPQCVGDMVDILGINQTTISHQLQILRKSNIVTYNRVGKNVYYSLINHIENVLDSVVDCVC